MNVAAHGLTGIGAGNDDVDAAGTRGSLRQSDRRDFRIRVRNRGDSAGVKRDLVTCDDLRRDLAFV